VLKRVTTEQELKDALANPKSPEGISVRLFQSVVLAVFGVGDVGEDRCWMTARFTHGGEADLAQLARIHADLLDLSKEAAEGAAADPNAPEAVKLFVRWQRELAASGVTSHDDRTAGIRFEAGGLKQVLSRCVIVPPAKHE
jgi:hypothetical protein